MIVVTIIRVLIRIIVVVITIVVVVVVVVVLGGSWDLASTYNWGYNPTYKLG